MARDSVYTAAITKLLDSFAKAALITLPPGMTADHARINLARNNQLETVLEACHHNPNFKQFMYCAELKVTWDELLQSRHQQSPPTDIPSFDLLLQLESEAAGVYGVVALCA